MTTQQNVRKTFWMVFSPSGVRPPKFKHGCEEHADKEAQRLARDNPGSEFLVLEAKKSFVKNDLTETKFQHDIPF